MRQLGCLRSRKADECPIAGLADIVQIPAAPAQLISPVKTIASSLVRAEGRSMSGCAATVAAGNVQGLYVGV